MAIIGGKYCCNCQYWEGSRRLSAFKNKVEVRSGSDEGICTNSRSANSRGKSRKANQAATCNHFEKWDEIK